MKTYCVFFILIVSVSVARAQDIFQAQTQITVPDSVAYTSMECADFDNDGLLDLAVFAENAAGKAVIFFYKNEATGDAFQYSGFFSLELSNTVHQLVDANADGRVDLLVSGRDTENGKLIALINQGSFSFISSGWLPYFTPRWLFINDDEMGFQRLVATTPDKINSYVRNNTDWILSSAWEATASQMLVAHLDDDGVRELVISGQWPSGPERQWIIRHPFTEDETIETVSELQSAVVAKADVNYNGIDDLLIGGESSTGETQYNTVRYVNGELSISDTLDHLSKPSQILIADFNSDGRLDVNILTQQNDGLQNLLYADSEIVLGQSLQSGSHLFGDIDRDGDLDLVQYSNGRVDYLQNTTLNPNEHPSAPKQPLLAQLFDRLFLSWLPSSDDHTPVSSITYDILIATRDGVVRTPMFNPSGGYRLNTSEGNNGPIPFVLMKYAADDIVDFKIQSVDNSLYGGAGGICTGQGVPCAGVEPERISVCGAGKVSLSMPVVADWYSFSRGYLGNGMTYEDTPTASDTVFAIAPSTGGLCPQVKIVTISRVATGEKVLEEQETACRGDVLEWNADAGWADYSWTSSETGFLSDDERLSFTVDRNDTVILTMSDGAGCSVTKKISVVESVPDVSVAVASYQIVRGGDVQLMASGASSYSWSPAANLNDPLRSDPVATPDQSTTYTVTGTDSLGCTAQATVMVRVEDTAFIPQMFTPNNDGTNDVLKIYGLGSVDHFLFTIYNRDGSKVFSTADPQHATTRGWDGWSNGILQPSGVYHWKVEGRLAAGVPLSLNGKVSGSIMLVR